MHFAAIRLTTTANLSLPQRRQADELTHQLLALLSPLEEETPRLTVHFRPSISGYEDRLVFYPENNEVMAYWSVMPNDDLEDALATLATHLFDLALPSSALVEALSTVGVPISSPAHGVLVYWAGPYSGDEATWQVRKLAAPGWYDRIQIQEIADFLHRQAPSPGPHVETVALSYHAYRAGAGPHHGFFQYRREEQLLVIDVPLDAAELPRLLSTPPLRRFMLSASLLAFLHLQADPDIPGLDFRDWLGQLEHQFRSSGFWEEEREARGMAR